MNEKSKDRQLRFSLKALIVIMSLVAVGVGAYFAGHRNGYQQGLRTASREWQANYAQMENRLTTEMQKR
jgi:hypothetical protein